jgi:glutamate synthase (NADPH/NADH) small chain
MDSTRTALRLGAEEVRIVYHRSRAELLARQEEIRRAEEEGVIFHFLPVPIWFLGDDAGWETGMECIRMELGKPDASGRRRLITVSGSDFMLACDLVVIAIGAGANPLLTNATPGLELNKWGYIVTKNESGATSKEGVWAGGDIVTGSATVILAMGAGRKAADELHRYLSNKP